MCPLLLGLPALALAASPSATATLGDVPVTVTASSELPGKTGRPYSVGHLLDGDPATAWVEGVDGLGVDQELRFAFGEARPVEGFLVWPGYGKSGDVYTGNATAHEVTVTVGEPQRLTLRQPVVMDESEHPPGPGGREGLTCGHVERPGARAAHIVLWGTPRTADAASLRVESVLAGEKWTDLVISEARPLLVGATDPLPGVEHARAFLRSLRDGSSAPTPERVLDVREHPDAAHRAELATWAAWGVPDKPAPAPVLGADAPKEERTAAAAAFLGATKRQLLGVAVAVVPTERGTWMVGARSGTFGDGEWLELSPAVLLGADGAVVELVELTYSDGAPGCHDVLPPLPGT